MASEVRVITDTWCDIHLLKDPNNTERVPSVWSGEVAVDRLRRHLDLCEPCFDQVIGDMPRVLEEFGSKIDSAAKAAPAAKSPHARPSSEPDGKEHVCPRCKMTFTARSGLTQHARNVHGKPLSVIEEEMGLPRSTGGQRNTRHELIKCPVCHKELMGRSGLGSHLRTHPGAVIEQPTLLKTG